MKSTPYEKYFESNLWVNDNKISALRTSISQVNERARKFLSEISNDFPQLTDHSIDHSLMLWNYVDIVLGEEKTAGLSPLEAYILHITFLIHDAGTCLSILSKESTIQTNPIYQDFITLHGDTEDGKMDAMFYTIRYMHGEYARRIATQQLSDGDFLIQDTGLRDEFGDLIGRIAQSHAHNVNFIENEIPDEYTAQNFPRDWTVRCRRLAYLLRVVDAAHLDNLRTPKSIEQINSLRSPSREHWTFQKKLGIPTRSPDRFLIYTTNSPFTVEEQKAWWYCYDALTMLDREIKAANEYFEFKNLPVLAVKGVKDINDPLSLSKDTLKTDRWYVFDTRVKVSNPVHIASELGGVKLYGEECLALRELIQNAIDAIIAYRVKTEQTRSEVGLIKVRVTQENNVFYLTVTDNGIGMSSSIMTNELLDFGTSYWKTNRFRLDHQGLVSSSFDSIGRFGIGFFSVFMLGNLVTVTSWRHGDARSEMKTLDFYDGLDSTPILRDPTESEQKSVIDRGTTVRAQLMTDPYSNTGFIGKKRFKNNTLDTLVKFLIPSADVMISVTEADGAINNIGPNYLESQHYSGYLDYLSGIANNGINLPLEDIRKLGLELIDVSDSTQLWGKLALTPPVGGVVNNGLGVAISKGIRVCHINSFLGFTRHDEVVTIKRDSPSKVIPYEALRDWGVKQHDAIKRLGLESLYGNILINLLFALDLYDEDTPILINKANESLDYLTVGGSNVFCKRRKN